MRGGYETYSLTPAERQRFPETSVPADEVPIRISEYNQYLAVVISCAQSGVIAGDLLTGHKNDSYDSEQPESLTNRPITFALTDEQNYSRMLPTAERKRQHEQHWLEHNIGALSLLGYSLSALERFDETHRERLSEAIRQVTEAERLARKPEKILANEALDRVDKLIESPGTRAPEYAQKNIEEATDLMAERELDLWRQSRSNYLAQGDWRDEVAADRIIKQIMERLAAIHPSISDNPKAFLTQGYGRRMKSGLLVVQNAWHRQEEPDSWEQMIAAQNGFEPLYDSLMVPLAHVRDIVIKNALTIPEQAAAWHNLELVVMEDDIDKIRIINSDYDARATVLMADVFEIEGYLLDQDFSRAKVAANKCRFDLRYPRDERKRPAPEWFTPLPDVKIAVDYKPPQMSDEEMWADLEKARGY